MIFRFFSLTVPFVLSVSPIAKMVHDKFHFFFCNLHCHKARNGPEKTFFGKRKKKEKQINGLFLFEAQTLFHH